MTLNSFSVQVQRRFHPSLCSEGSWFHTSSFLFINLKLWTIVEKLQDSEVKVTCNILSKFFVLVGVVDLATCRTRMEPRLDWILRGMSRREMINWILNTSSGSFLDTVAEIQLRVKAFRWEASGSGSQVIRGCVVIGLRLRFSRSFVVIAFRIYSD